MRRWVFLPLVFCSTAQFFYCKHWVFPDGQARLWRAGKVKRGGCQAASTKVGQWMSKMFLGKKKKKMQEAVCCSVPSSKIREEEKKKKLERKQVRLKWETHVERILVKKNKKTCFQMQCSKREKKKCSMLFWWWIAEGFLRVSKPA